MINYLNFVCAGQIARQTYKLTYTVHIMYSDLHPNLVRAEIRNELNTQFMKSQCHEKHALLLLAHTYYARVT